MENLYKGPLDDIYATAIRNCDPEGPLMLYVSKMIPALEKGCFFTISCVFVGRVTTGLKVRIMGLNYVRGQKKGFICKECLEDCDMNGKGTRIWLGCALRKYSDYGLVRLVHNKNVMLTNEKEFDSHLIRAMKFFVSPIVHVVV